MKKKFQKTFTFSAQNLNEKSKSDSVTLFDTKWQVEQLAKGVSLSKAGFNLNGTVLYESENLTVTFPEGFIEFEPTVEYDWEIENRRVKTFHAIAKGELNVVSDIAVTATEGINLQNTISLAKLGATYLGTIGPVPIAVEAKLTLLAGFDIDAEVKGNIQSGFSSEGSLEIGARYENG